MLILNRRFGEKLKIGNDVTLTVLGMNGNQIKLGIDAPSQTPVHREEIYNRIQANKR